MKASIFRYHLTTTHISAAAGTRLLQVARDGRMGTRLINTNYNDFAPRFGIAYSPSNKWSFRAGFGLFYSQESKNSIFDLIADLAGRTVSSARYLQAHRPSTTRISSMRLRSP